MKRPPLPTLDETRRRAAEELGRPLTPAEDSAVVAWWFAAAVDQPADTRSVRQIERQGWRKEKPRAV